LLSAIDIILEIYFFISWVYSVDCNFLISLV